MFRSKHVRVAQIVGAGPAGLSAAITLARAGCEVIVHEAQSHVGRRFEGDLQGLENWSAEQDVLDELTVLGLTPQWNVLACREGTAFDAWGRAYPMKSRRPLFYLLERGPAEGTLDSVLLRQAQALGVVVRFNSRAERLEGPGILAGGPKTADAIAVGYHFETSMADGFWVICDDELAPRGYAYLLVRQGRGTVKSCLFRGFKNEHHYVEQTVVAFHRLVGLDMQRPKMHGGAANFRLPVVVRAGMHPVTGEQAGIQDALWGFGMRMAMRSGVLAAQSLLGECEYERAWRTQLAPWARSSVVNRAIYDRLGNRGYRWCLKRQARTDARALLNRVCGWSWPKRLLEPWAARYVRSGRLDRSCDHVDCTCIWCRCGGVLNEECKQEDPARKTASSAIAPSAAP